MYIYIYYVYYIIYIIMLLYPLYIILYKKIRQTTNFVFFV